MFIRNIKTDAGERRIEKVNLEIMYETVSQRHEAWKFICYQVKSLKLSR